VPRKRVEKQVDVFPGLKARRLCVLNQVDGSLSKLNYFDQTHQRHQSKAQFLIPLAAVWVVYLTTAIENRGRV